MFSNEIERASYPIAQRLPTVALAMSVLVAVVASLVSARTTPGGWALICVAIFIGAWSRLSFSFARRESRVALMCVTAFFTYATASALWADTPLAPLRAGLFALVTTFITLGAIANIRSMSRPLVLHMAEGLWLGLLIALTYFLIEVASGQVIKVSVYNAIGLGPDDLKPVHYFKWADDGSLKRISANDMTRNTAPITLILWPAMLAAVGVLRTPNGWFVSWLLLGLAGICIFLSPHETSKLSIVAGGIVFLIAKYSWSYAKYLVATGWVAACLLIMPLSIIAYDAGLHEQEGVIQKSARARIIIWNETARKTLESPIIGVGARMTYEIGPRLLAEQKPNEDTWFPAKLSRHAHNIFLQSWFELGALGVLLLAICGVAVVRVIASLPREHGTYAYATFACAATVGFSSYGMWQAWFMGLYAMVPILVTIAHVAASRDKA